MQLRMCKNKLVIASAGSGKTTYLINKALITNGRVLITTFTEANEAQIRQEIIRREGCIPSHITIQTWFSFLLQHGVRPYQGVLYPEHINGMLLVNQLSGVKYYQGTRKVPITYKESETSKFYLSPNRRIYSDKIARFSLNCNTLSKDSVINRLSRIYSHIFIDEAQDLAGYDLDILELFFKSTIEVLLVCDPRQTIYLTHHANRNKKYAEGKIKDFMLEKCRKMDIKIDEGSLINSHRNNADICNLSSDLFPDLPASVPCTCKNGICDRVLHSEGIFLVRPNDIESYLEEFSPVQLRLNKSTKGINRSYKNMNFGVSKGQSFDRVLIFPTEDMSKWITDHNQKLKPKTRAQFYVSITRARHSVGIVYNYTDKTNIPGIQKYIPPSK